jgi:hypothetical protein
LACYGDTKHIPGPPHKYAKQSAMKSQIVSSKISYFAHHLIFTFQMELHIAFWHQIHQAHFKLNSACIPECHPYVALPLPLLCEPNNKLHIPLLPFTWMAYCAPLPVGSRVASSSTNFFDHLKCIVRFYITITHITLHLFTIYHT